MADWRNRMEQITNKVKHQLNAKGVDSIAQLKCVFEVSVFFLLAASSAHFHGVSKIQIINHDLLILPLSSNSTPIRMEYSTNLNSRK